MESKSSEINYDKKVVKINLLKYGIIAFIIGIIYIGIGIYFNKFYEYEFHVMPIIMLIEGIILERLSMGLITKHMSSSKKGMFFVGIVLGVFGIVISIIINKENNRVIMLVKKMNFIIIMIVIVISILIPFVKIFGTGIYYRFLVRTSKKNISQIDACEFENKVINKLKESCINLNNDDYTTEFLIYNDDKSDMNGYIVAHISEKKSRKKRNEMYMPILKVERDRKGNIGNFICVSYKLYFNISLIIKDILKQDYDTNFYYQPYMEIYYEDFPFVNKYHPKTLKKIHLIYTNDEFVENVIKEIIESYAGHGNFREDDVRMVIDGGSLSKWKRFNK